MEETSSTSLVVVGEEPWGVLEEAFMVTRVPTVEEVVEADMVLMVMEQKEWWRVAYNLLVLAEKAQKIAIVLMNGPAETTIESLGVSLKSVKPDLTQGIMRASSSNPSEVRRHLPGNAMRNLTVCKYIKENHIAIGQALTVSRGEWDVT